MKRLLAGACLLAGAVMAGPACAGGKAGLDVERGKQLFADCAACHSLSAGEHLTGPSLFGIVGRKAGTAPGFRYSGAMTRSGVTWNRASLDKYLEAPQAFIAGNRMPYSGMLEERDRAALIAYLKLAGR